MPSRTDRARGSAPLLVLDNYDSFTHNAVDLLAQLGARPEVVRNDQVGVAELIARGYCGVVISPGPGRPRDAGVTLELLRRWPVHVPVLGICLGHQSLAQALGGRVRRAREPLHGSASRIDRSMAKATDLVAALPRVFTAARYHSLVVDPQSPGRQLRVTCWSERGEIMGLAHRRRPWEGVQFHPESFLTPLGPRLLAAFLRRCGVRPRAASGVRR